MRFFKYQGIGNDFILLDGMNGIAVNADLCRRMCDRNFGIGADGVLYVLPGKNGSDVTMRVINSDGSEAEMCGNGIRCVAKYAYDNGIVKTTSFTVNTQRGNLRVDVSVDNGKVGTVRVDMGAPILECSKIPMNCPDRFIDQTIECCDIDVNGTAVSMGNPHFVTFDVMDNVTIDELGPALERHPVFPKRANIEFAKIKDGKIYIRVYERGAAWTLACGTGACATATAAALNKLVPFDTPIDVHLPGGWLKITVDSKLQYVLMEGPATYVYSGEYITG